MNKRWRDKARAEGRESYFNDLATSRRLKDKYRGICERCGGVTSSTGYKDKPYRYCRGCKEAVYGPSVEPGTGVRQQQILAVVQEPTRAEEVARQLGITKNNAHVTLFRLFRLGLVERPRRGVYKAVQT